MNNALNNSEILFIYEARLCNPNGDPDEENRPRIDIKTGRNLVSDLRLKRYFRDYVIGKFGEEYVWVSKVEGKHVSSDGRLEALKKQLKKEKNLEEELPKLCIDARLFGATIPIRAEGARGERGASKAFIGPVQFSWGYSFHKVEIVESSTITSTFVGRERRGGGEMEEAYGTMGKDWRLYYSLIGFYGVISGRRARGTYMDENDVKILDNLLWKAVSLEPTTRSKIGENPHLYLRVEYKDADTIIGDFRKYIKADTAEPVRDFSNVKLDFNGLIDKLSKNKESIAGIYLISSEEMSNVRSLFETTFEDAVKSLPHPIDEDKLKANLRKGM